MRLSIKLLAFTTAAVLYFVWAPFADAQVQAPASAQTKAQIPTWVDTPLSKAGVKHTTVHHTHAAPVSRHVKVTFVKESDWANIKPVETISPRVKEAIVNRGRIPASIDNEFRKLE